MAKPTKYTAPAQKFQGDVMIAPIPALLGIALDESAREIPLSKAGMLILAEGEVTGHHHAFRPVYFRDDGLARELVTEAPAIAVTLPKLYKHPAGLETLVEKRVVRDDARALFVGFLDVPVGAPPLTHEEHSPITLEPGLYFVMRKREWTAKDQQIVAD